MFHIEIDHLSFKARAILHRGINACRERGRDQTTGNRTTFDLSLVFGYLQRLMRKFEDLALLTPEDWLLTQGAATAPSTGTTAQRVKSHVVGLGDGLEGSTRMSWLTARSAPRLLAEGFGGGFGQAVRTRWFATIATVERQARFEFFDFAAQLAHFVLQAQQ